MNTSETFFVYTDGGARGNPGPAGAGAMAMNERGDVIVEAHKALGRATNNYAEYEAVILGLESLKRKIGKDRAERATIEVRMDSELVQRQLSGEYQIKEETLWPLFIKIWNMRVADVPHVRFVHIPREQNAHADRLSNIAMDESECGPEKTLFT